MHKLITIARPYAKAVFELAIKQNNIKHWQHMLAFSAKVSQNKQVIELLSSFYYPKKLAEIFIFICDKELDIFGQNLIRIMAVNKRLTLLPAVLNYFIFLCKLQKNTVEIDVISANKLKIEQLRKVHSAMEQHLMRRVVLNCKIDKSMLAGIVIKSDDMVIDGSLRCCLERFADFLIL